MTPRRTRESSTSPPGILSCQLVLKTSRLVSYKIMRHRLSGYNPIGVYLLDLGVALDVNLFPTVLLEDDGTDSVEGDGAGQVGPVPGNKSTERA
jgi:hypothetical protein